MCARKLSYLWPRATGLCSCCCFGDCLKKTIKQLHTADNKIYSAAVKNSKKEKNTLLLLCYAKQGKAVRRKNTLSHRKVIELL